jgi:hypothetical protein
MKVPLTFRGVLAAVTGAALLGMVLGGLFGLAAGALAPTLFAQMLMWTKLEPLGTAAVLGAIVGVLLGGGLGVFGIAVQTAVQMFGRGQDGAAPKD